VRKALHDLEEIGVASNDTPLTAFVYAGVERSSTSGLEDAMTLESAIGSPLRAQAAQTRRSHPAHA